MDPLIQQLADALLQATQEFAAKQTPGVPIDFEGPDAKRIEAILNEMKGPLEKQVAQERAQFQSQVDQIKQDLAAWEAKAAEVPPPPERLEDLPPGTVTFRFQEQRVPQSEVMQPVVEALLKLAKE